MARATLSLVRPGALPRVAPTGTRARDIPSDAWVDHPGFGCTPQRLVAVLRLAEAGSPRQQCELFDDVIETDGHLRNLFEKRAQAVAGKPSVVQAGGPDADDALQAQVLADAWARLATTEILEHLLSFNRYGYAACEVDWGVRVIGGRFWVVPVHIACVPARRFRVNTRTDELLLVTEENPNGEPLEPGKWIVVRRSGDRVVRSGLMRTGVWNALYKRYGTRDWVVGAEKYGLPLPLVKYKETADDEAKDVAEEIADNIGNDGAAVVPDTIDVEIVDARTGDFAATHGGLIAFCNRENSKLVNGSTLSNDAGESGSGGSYGLGEVHDSVRWEAVQYDAERVQDAFRMHLAAPFASFNGFDVARPALLKIQVVRDLEPKARTEVAERMQRMGMAISESQMRQETGLREPLGDDDTLIAPAPAAQIGAAA
jgi:phage gp29-like protein